jgi:small subunit ribosomal protein S27Ae|eukprot:490524_1
MQVFVNTNNATTAYAVDSSTSVEALKAMIENKEFLPSHLIRLVNGATDLEAGTLLGNGIEDEDTLSLFFDVTGGMRKKWKKKRMRRLRRKRRKMRQRAR